MQLLQWVASLECSRKGLVLKGAADMVTEHGVPMEKIDGEIINTA